jgi:hypothetical protein
VKCRWQWFQIHGRFLWSPFEVIIIFYLYSKKILHLYFVIVNNRFHPLVSNFSLIMFLTKMITNLWQTNLFDFWSFHVAHCWDKEMTKYKITSAREIECVCFSWSSSRTPFNTQFFYSYHWLFKCLHEWGKTLKANHFFLSTSSFAFMINH